MTDIVTPPAIDALPPAPLPTDTPENFNTKAFATLAAQVALVTQVNASNAATHQNAVAANERAVAANASAVAAGLSETAAETAKDDAIDARDLAQTYAAAAGAAAGLPALAGKANKLLRVKTDESGVEWVAGVNSVNGSTGAVTLKTINGAAIDGAGDITVSGGAMIYLGTVTAAAAASADLTGLDAYASAYSHLVVVGTAVWGATGNEIRVTFQQGGSWAASSYEYAQTTATTAGAPTSGQSGSTTYVPICSQGAAAALASSVIVQIHMDASTPSIEWTASGYNSAAGRQGVRGFAWRGGTVLQGLRFAANTGNVNGVFRLYGIKKT